MSRDKIAVIIPCYNEALTIGKVIDDFRRELPEASVYVYDNNSTDGTAAIARSRGAVVRLEPRQGKERLMSHSDLWASRRAYTSPSQTPCTPRSRS